MVSTKELKKEFEESPYQGEIRDLIKITKVTGRESSVNLCTNHSKKDPFAEQPRFTDISVEGSDKSLVPSVPIHECPGNIQWGTIHTHPHVPDTYLRLSESDRETARKNNIISCVAGDKKVVCEDFRDDKEGEKIDFEVRWDDVHLIDVWQNFRQIEGGRKMGPSSPEEEWYEDADRRLYFANILSEADEFKYKSQILKYFQEPWMWNPVHELWEETGEPGPLGENWDNFLDQLDAKRQEELDEVI